MGKKARGKRTEEKRYARAWGYKETELGELKATTTKAEARRRFLDRYAARMGFENYFVTEMCRIAAEDICKIEDERVIEELTRMADTGELEGASP